MQHLGCSFLTKLVSVCYNLGVRMQHIYKIRGKLTNSIIHGGSRPHRTMLVCESGSPEPPSVLDPVSPSPFPSRPPLPRALRHENPSDQNTHLGIPPRGADRPMRSTMGSEQRRSGAPMEVGPRTHVGEATRLEGLLLQMLEGREK